MLQSFKMYMLNEASKETHWTKTLSDKDMKDHLEYVKAKGIWNAMLKHPAYSSYHSNIATGNKTGFQHKIDSDGFHHIRLASTGKPTENLHFISSNRGKIFTVNHNKIETDSDGNKVRSLIKRYENN